MHDDTPTTDDNCFGKDDVPAGIGIAHVGLDGRFLLCNRRFAEITGFAPAELQQLTFHDITHPDDLADDIDHARHLADGKIPTYSMEKRYIRKDGQPIWIRLTGSLVRNEQGAPHYFIAAIEDIEIRKRAEAQALRWQHLFESAEFGLVQVDLASNRFIEVNPTFARQRGYTPEELQGRSLLDIYPPEAQERLRQNLDLIDSTGHAVFEAVHQRKDGSCFPVLVEATVIKDDGGRPICRVAYALDISERKQIEEALRSAHAENARHLAQLETVLDNMTEGLVVADLEGKVYHWNRAALEMHGFATLDECRRRLHEFRHIFELADLDGNLLPFERWPLSRILQGEHIKNLELQLRRLGSEWRRIYSYSGALAKGSNHAPLFAVLNISDVTERKRSEAALQRYQLIADHSRDIILFIRRADGRILDANYAASKVYGYSHEELLALTVYDLRAVSSLEQAESQLAAADERGLLFETMHRRKDGSTFPVGVSSQGSTIAGERVLISVVRDITQRKRYEEELLRAREAAEAASQAKSRFLASVSHEIRTPMTVFLGALEQLQQLDRNPQRRQLLDLAEQSAQRLHALINDVLDFSRIEAERLELEAEPFDLPDCLEKVMRMMQPLADDKGLVLALDVAPALPRYVVGDQYRLEQVLINLVSNAIKFTAQGGVRVAVQADGERLAFAVSDTGIGIPEDKQELIFQVFSQVDSSSTRRFGGTGLGLAISRRLVELMGGAIGVRSRAGVGSEFFFSLPLQVAGQPQPAPTIGTTVHPLQVAVPGRILLAEDNPLVRDIVLTMLVQRGWTVEAVAGGSEAVRRWQEGDFNLVLMDLQMPDMDGLEATRRIRALAAQLQKKAYIVGLTAHATPAMREECLRTGMDEVLIKPFEAARLYAVIEKGL